MIRSLLDHLAVKFGALFTAAAVAFLAAAPASAATVNISGASCTWDSGSQTLTCSSGGGGGAGAPSCSINAPTTVASGATFNLTANCSGGSGSYSSYRWNTGATTQTISTAISIQTTFTVTVTDTNNQQGSASATVSVTTGGGGGPPPAGLANCTSQGFTVVGGAATVLTWGQSYTLHSRNNGSFGDGSWWVMQITVPQGASQALGNFNGGEDGGAPVFRQAVVSTLPCDTRPRDYTGQAGPLVVSNGTAVFFNFYVGAPQFFGGNAGLTPGQTYYVSVRNWAADWNNWSCGQTSCPAFMQVNPPQ